MIEFSNEIHSIISCVAAKAWSQLWLYKLKWLFIKTESIFFVHKRALTVYLKPL